MNWFPLAASGSSNPPADFMGDVAKRLGISQHRLEGAIEDATIARIDAAVAAGDVTKEEGEALKERVRSGITSAELEWPLRRITASMSSTSSSPLT